MRAEVSAEMRIIMAKKRIVVALGRCAFGETFPEQRRAVRGAAKAIADLAEQKYEIVVTHSNGPQIGMVHTAMTEFASLDPKYTVAPMSLCSAMSQGYIGYDLQNVIRTELLNRGIYKPVATVITQVKVDPFDKAFRHPSKIIGRYMTEEEALAEEKKGNYVVKEEKGYRRIIASPKPIDVYEIDTIKALLNARQIVIAGGGGGIPVLEQGTVLKGASAVIEKDLTAAKIAEMVQADTLLLLTGVEKVCLHYATPEEKEIDFLDPDTALSYMEQGFFGEGSMKPKVEAAINFASTSPEHVSVITHLEKALDGLTGRTGTRICLSDKQ